MFKLFCEIMFKYWPCFTDKERDTQLMYLGDAEIWESDVDTTNSDFF